jgi:hypothetical protein
VARTERDDDWVTGCCSIIMVDCLTVVEAGLVLVVAMALSFKRCARSAHPIQYSNPQVHRYLLPNLPWMPVSGWLSHVQQINVPDFIYSVARCPSQPVVYVFPYDLVVKDVNSVCGCGGSDSASVSVASL